MKFERIQDFIQFKNTTILQEAIMVLHNRIKEFEGLIQYIEVQTSYETSDER